MALLSYDNNVFKILLPIIIVRGLGGQVVDIIKFWPQA
jgi:hypothetical protein